MISLWILLAPLLAAAGPAEAVPESPPPKVVLKGADLVLLEEVRRIATHVERIRTEKFERPPLAVRVQEEMRRVAAEIRAFNVLPRARLEARGRAWEDVGLGGVEGPTNLLLALAADLEGLGFDPEGNRLLITPDRLTSRDFEPRNGDDEALATLLQMTGVRIDEPIVAHLLLHVLQRERRGRDLLEPTTDRLLAAMAWAEGEANLVAVRYLFAGMNLADAVLQHRLDPSEVLGGRLLPERIAAASGVERQLLEFVYLEGFAAAAEQFQSGGWDALSAAARRRQTTAGLLHPDVGVSEPEPSAAPAPAPPAITGLRLADEDTLGEQGIIALVSWLTGKDNLGLLAGDGWAGDRLFRWEVEGAGEGITEWRTLWRNLEAAEDFSYAMRRALTARFPESPGREVARGSVVVETGSRVFRLESKGSEVRLRIAPPALDARLERGATGSPDP